MSKGKGSQGGEMEDRRWEEEEEEWGEEGKRSLFLGKSCKLPRSFGTSFQINIVEGAWLHSLKAGSHEVINWMIA